MVEGKKNALELMREIEHGPVTKELLDECVAHESYRARQKVAWAYWQWRTCLLNKHIRELNSDWLCDLSEADWIGYLEKIAEDLSCQVRESVAMFAANLVHGLLMDDEDAVVRAALVKGVGYCHCDPTVRHKVYDSAFKDSDPRVRTAYIKAVCGDKHCLPQLESLADDADCHVRSLAADAIQEIRIDAERIADKIREKNEQ